MLVFGMNDAEKRHVSIDITTCYVDWYNIDHSMLMYVCRSRERDTPLGFVWGKYRSVDKQVAGDTSSKVFDVHGSFVPVWFRRNGVRKLINDEIFKSFDFISSQTATELGEAFMTKMGYKRHRVCGWYLPRPLAKSKRTVAKRDRKA